MDAGTAKKLIEKNLSYDEVKRLALKLVQHASPQTALLEAEPQVLALIRDIVKPELEQAGLRPLIDGMGNLILHIKGRSQIDRLMLVGYAMNAAPSTMKNPYSGDIVDGAPYKLNGECVWGRGACEQKGSLAAMLFGSLSSRQHRRRDWTARFAGVCSGSRSGGSGLVHHRRPAPNTTWQ
jgi:acetylornithine deacetylase/succinyl-diaminopimelate desuccinylase-like protein